MHQPIDRWMLRTFPFDEVTVLNTVAKSLPFSISGAPSDGEDDESLREAGAYTCHSFIRLIHSVVHVSLVHSLESASLPRVTRSFAQNARLHRGTHTRFVRLRRWWCGMKRTR